MSTEQMNPEFTAIIINDGGNRPVMSKPKPFKATKKFIQHVQDNLPIPDDKAVEAADWVLNLMERYGANSAQPVFDMEGNGPLCSWCFMIWPLCGHHHMSSNLGNDDEEGEDDA
jgi:hypothetical protein